jgi:hypothetical protein
MTRRLEKASLRPSGDQLGEPPDAIRRAFAARVSEIQIVP